jgi:hypothetical protein
VESAARRGRRFVLEMVSLVQSESRMPTDQRYRAQRNNDLQQQASPNAQAAERLLKMALDVDVTYE